MADAISYSSSSHVMRGEEEKYEPGDLVNTPRAYKSLRTAV
jgi:hypothetical protein